MEKLLTIHELCTILQVSRSTVYRWVHYEFIPHIKLGNAVRFDEKSVSKWLRTKEQVGRTQINIDIDD